jgi:hypothetical protein
MWWSLAAAYAAPIDLESARRAHRLERTGAITMAVGVGVGGAFALSVPVVCAATDGDCLPYVFFVGIPVELGAAAVTLTGGGLMFGGGIAASKRSGNSTALGWTGLGLLGAGTAAIVFAAPGTDDYDTALTVGGIGSAAAGTVLGVVQVARNGRLLREGVALMPTLNGVAIGGRF